MDISKHSKLLYIYISIYSWYIQQKDWERYKHKMVCSNWGQTTNLPHSKTNTLLGRSYRKAAVQVIFLKPILRLRANCLDPLPHCGHCPPKLLSKPSSGDSFLQMLDSVENHLWHLFHDNDGSNHQMKSRADEVAESPQSRRGRG